MTPQIQVLACESLGVRAFALKVITSEGILVVDPSVALAPHRGGYPVSPPELEAYWGAWERIRHALGEARWVAITHYHHDHQVPYLPDFFPSPPPEIFLKSPEDTNRSQRDRAALLIRALQERGMTYHSADGLVRRYGSVTITFSASLFHGSTPRLGQVIMVGVAEDDFRMLYTSDIQGPVRDDHREAIVRYAPHVLFLDPPMAPKGRMPDVFFTHMKQIVGKSPALSEVVVDHHPLRDLGWERWWTPLETWLHKRKIKLRMGAQWNGQNPQLLEAQRKAYWEQYRENTRG